MSEIQRVIKYLAIAFAIFLSVNIIGGILSAMFIGLSMFGFVTDKQERKEEAEVSTQMVEFKQNEEEIENLRIEIGYSKLTIVAGEKLKVETTNKDKTVEVKKTNHTLQIKDDKIWNLFNAEEQAEIKITVPKNVLLDKVKIEAGSGEVMISSMQMSTLDFKVGAGNVRMENIVVEKKTSIDGGAGKVVIQDSTLNDLDLDVGVGEFQIQNTTLLGNSDIDAGIGRLEVNLKGKREDYRIIGNRGLGSFTIENKEIEDNQIYGDGENKIKVEAGVGRVEVNFMN